jgi:hypothetical protein
MFGGKTRIDVSKILTRVSHAQINREGKMMVIILASYLPVRFDKSVIKSDVPKILVHGIVRSQLHINS